jgi:hypothetical protein
MFAMERTEKFLSRQKQQQTCCNLSGDSKYAFLYAGNAELTRLSALFSWWGKSPFPRSRHGQLSGPRTAISMLFSPTWISALLPLRRRLKISLSGAFPG